jgi:hypothetical protein
MEFTRQRAELSGREFLVAHVAPSAISSNCVKDAWSIGAAHAERWGTQRRTGGSCDVCVTFVDPEMPDVAKEPYH